MKNMDKIGVIFSAILIIITLFFAYQSGYLNSQQSGSATDSVPSSSIRFTSSMTTISTIAQTPPDTATSLYGTWKGTFNTSYTGKTGCTFKDRGDINMTIRDITKSSFSGSSWTNGIEIRNDKTCGLFYYARSDAGSVNGTFEGDRINAQFTFKIFDNSLSTSINTYSWKGTISNNVIKGKMYNKNATEMGLITLIRQ
jgi:hypothetical protein